MVTALVTTAANGLVGHGVPGMDLVHSEAFASASPVGALADGRILCHGGTPLGRASTAAAVDWDSPMVDSITAKKGGLAFS